MVVPKKNGKHRVCIDFTDLNKACPKDYFPLPHIDSLVDATSGHELLTFMDAFLGIIRFRCSLQIKRKRPLSQIGEPIVIK